jgi:hypothetical protein
MARSVILSTFRGVFLICLCILGVAVIVALLELVANPILLKSTGCSFSTQILFTCRDGWVGHSMAIVLNLPILFSYAQSYSFRGQCTVWSRIHAFALLVRRYLHSRSDLSSPDPLCAEKWSAQQLTSAMVIRVDFGMSASCPVRGQSRKCRLISIWMSFKRSNRGLESCGMNHGLGWPAIRSSFRTSHVAFPVLTIDAA